MSPTGDFSGGGKVTKRPPKGCGPLETHGVFKHRFALWQRPSGEVSVGLLRNAACCGGGFEIRSLPQHRAAYEVEAAPGWDDCQAKAVRPLPCELKGCSLDGTGGFLRGTQQCVPLKRAFSFAISFCTSKKKWRVLLAGRSSHGTSRTPFPTISA